MTEVAVDIGKQKDALEKKHKSTGVSPGMQKIEHVVVLMLENRGFDHFMGMLYRPDQFDGLNHVPCKPKERKGKLLLKLRKDERDLHEEASLFEGLSGLSKDELERLANDYDFAGCGFELQQNGVKTSQKGTIPLRIGARAGNVPCANPHEDFVHIFEDMYYGTTRELTIPKLFEKMKRKADREKLIRKADGSYLVPAMKGFVQNFGDGIAHHTHKHKFEKDLLEQILDMYTPDQLPVISFLARHYALSDFWFCSVPSQTNTNRAFWTCGSARGLVTNNFYDPFHKTPKDTHSDALPADDGSKVCRTLFDVLQENGVSWKYYSSMNYPFGSNLYFSLMFPHFADQGTVGSDWLYSKNLPMVGQFFKDVQKGELPAVSYIEPRWGGGPAWEYVRQEMIPRAVGNEFHPVADTMCGEFFVKQVYDAVSQSPKWNQTLLVITFDENGGTYDHRAPWPALPTGRDVAPRINQGKTRKAYVGLASTYYDQFEDQHEKDEKSGLGAQFGFTFDVYGVRVPTLLISPLIRPNTIFRSPTQIPFDHTSVISTILKWKGIEPATSGLGHRVAFAPSFDGVLQGNPELDKTGLRPREHAVWGIAPTARPGKEKEKPVQYGESVKLRYVGNWNPLPPNIDNPDAWNWLGGEQQKPAKGEKNPPPPTPVYTRLGGWLYPIFTPRARALSFTLTRGADAQSGRREGEALKNGMAVEFQYDSLSDGRAYRLGVPTSKVSGPNSIGASTVWLNSAKGGDCGTGWRIWLVDDRINGKNIYPGDLVFLLSEEYDMDKVNSGLTGYDPYQKLTRDPNADIDHDDYVYAKFRAGAWDAWVIERADEDPPKCVAPHSQQSEELGSSGPGPSATGKLRGEVQVLCDALNDSVDRSSVLRGALLDKWMDYCVSSEKGKSEVDKALHVQVQNALAAAVPKRTVTRGTGSGGKESGEVPDSGGPAASTDGRPGYFTGVNGDDGKPQANRESCLSQVDNTCGVRAAYNCLVLGGVAKEESHDELWRWSAESFAPDKTPFRVLSHAVNLNEDRIETFLAGHKGEDAIVFSNYLYWDRMLLPKDNKEAIEPTAGARRLKAFQEEVKGYLAGGGKAPAPVLRMVLHVYANVKEVMDGHFFAAEIKAGRDGKHSWRWRDSLNTPDDRNPLIQWFVDHYLPKSK